jgi:hypothetical protein
MRTMMSTPNYKATAISHPLAASVENIRSLVLVVLDPISSQYNWWCGLILLTLECYALADQVLFDVPRSDILSWRQMDCIVLF